MRTSRSQACSLNGSMHQSADLYGPSSSLASSEAGSRKQSDQSEPEADKVELNVDCGCCSLSFQSGGAASLGKTLGHLVIRFKKAGWVPNEDAELLLAALERVLSTQTDFAVTCDFQNGQPPPKLATSLDRFVHENKDRWARYATSMALLIRSNIFVECARGVIGTFMKLLLPGCPAIVCHCEDIACEFFMAATSSSAIGHEFVSVVKIQEDSPTNVTAAGTSYCLAFLAPLLKELDASNIESTLHVLPNGDVRVIQSPADDVMMRGGSLAGKPTGGAAMHTIGDCPSALSALKFEGCKRDLAKLIGAHFHIGELIADSEVESLNRKEAIATLRLQREGSIQGCWEGALQALARICEASLVSTGGGVGGYPLPPGQKQGKLLG